MVRIKSKVAVAMIAVAVVLLLSAGIGYAYWFVSQNIAGNTFTSGEMSISVVDAGYTTLTPITASGMIPALPATDGSNRRIYAVQSADGNPNTDLVLGVANIAGDGTLKDNLKVAIAVTTGGLNAYWLEKTGAVPMTSDEQLSPQTSYAAHAVTLSDLTGVSWTGMTGYTNMPAGVASVRHILVFYYLPIEANSDSQGSSATFDLSVELMQHH